MHHIHHTPAVQAAQSLQHRFLRHRFWHLSAMTALGLLMAWGQAHAQAAEHSSHGSHGAQAGAADSSTPAAADNQELSDGEVTRWDVRTGKVTLRHGEIKNLGMPPMTMVFTLQDPAVGQALKVGDKVRFRVADMNGALIVTQIEAAH